MDLCEDSQRRHLWIEANEKKEFILGHFKSDSNLAFQSQFLRQNFTNSSAELIHLKHNYYTNILGQ